MHHMQRNLALTIAIHSCCLLVATLALPVLYSNRLSAEETGDEQRLWLERRRQSAENVDDHSVIASARNALSALPTNSDSMSRPRREINPNHGRLRISARHLRGRRRRIREAVDYLIRYGYISSAHAKDEKMLHESIREFQEIAGVEQTGVVDRATLKHMRMKRCGNADIVSMPSRGGRGGRRRRTKRFAQVSKWNNKITTDDTLRLKWFVEKYTKDIPKNSIRDIVTKAFKLWSDQVAIPSIRTLKLDFPEGRDAKDADIDIMWAEGNHGDDYPFDGPGNSSNILAHTFYPNYQETGTLNGDIHFDDFERWVLDNSTEARGVHFPYVLVHEIGHALGLGHSKRQEAVMNPIYKQQPLETIALDIDDKCAVNWNYIGPSNTCLFVWLMVELLPRARESNSSRHGIGSSVITNEASESEIIGSLGTDPRHPQSPEKALERQINMTLQRLTDVPQCTDENNVQEQYEHMLKRKLDFTTESAQVYGPVICNFFEGLSTLASKKRRQSGVADELFALATSDDNTASLRMDEQDNDAIARLLRVIQSSPTLETVDDDSAGAAAEGGDEPRFVADRLRRSVDDLSDENDLSITPKKTIFDKDFFDEKFFHDLLKLLQRKVVSVSR